MAQFFTLITPVILFYIRASLAVDVVGYIADGCLFGTTGTCRSLAENACCAFVQNPVQNQYSGNTRSIEWSFLQECDLANWFTGSPTQSCGGLIKQSYVDVSPPRRYCMGLGGARESVGDGAAWRRLIEFSTCAAASVVSPGSSSGSSSGGLIFGSPDIKKRDTVLWDELNRNSSSQCTQKHYADVTEFVKDGLWLLEGSLHNHQRFHRVPLHITNKVERIKLAGGIWLKHPDDHERTRGMRSQEGRIYFVTEEEFLQKRSSTSGIDGVKRAHGRG